MLLTNVQNMSMLMMLRLRFYMACVCMYDEMIHEL